MHFDIAEKFALLSKDEKVDCLNTLCHLLPTSGVDFNEEQSQKIEHSVDMLRRASLLVVYTGPSQGEFLARLKTLESSYAEPVEAVGQEPTRSYIDPDSELGKEVTPTIPKAKEPVDAATAKDLKDYYGY